MKNSNDTLLYVLQDMISGDVLIVDTTEGVVEPWKVRTTTTSTNKALWLAEQFYIRREILLEAATIH